MFTERLLIGRKESNQTNQQNKKTRISSVKKGQTRTVHVISD